MRSDQITLHNISSSSLLQLGFPEFGLGPSPARANPAQAAYNAPPVDEGGFRAELIRELSNKD